MRLALLGGPFLGRVLGRASSAAVVELARVLDYGPERPALPARL